MREYKNTYHRPDQKYSMDMALYAAGHSRCKAGQSYGPIVRRYHVLHFVIQGKGVLEIKNLSIPIHAGQGFLIPAGIIARYQADDKDPWEYAWVNYYGLQADRYVDFLLSATHTRYVFQISDPLYYLAYIQELLQLQDSSVISVCESLAGLYRILGKLGQDVDMNTVSKITHNVIEDVKFYIDMNISETLRICELADKFCIHQNYLIRRFTDTYGISPKQYIIDSKLMRAKELLQETDNTVALISQSLGFSDQAAFSRTFKKKYGCSPSAMRQKSA